MREILGRRDRTPLESVAAEQIGEGAAGAVVDAVGLKGDREQEGSLLKGKTARGEGCVLSLIGGL